MKAIVKALFFSFVALLLTVQVHADAPSWEVDPAHSGVYFRIQHIYSTIPGLFEDFSGTVKFSPDDLQSSHFDFEVMVKSINTGNSKRDGHLNSAEFFDAGKYPKMTFTSTSVKHVKDNQYIVEGTMTVKDVNQTVAVPFVFLGAKTHPFNKQSEVAGFEARMTIDRLARCAGCRNCHRPRRGRGR